jgi:hypothetical protein
MWQAPRPVEELLGLLASFGIAMGLTKLLRSRDRITWRAVFGRAFEGAALSMCAGVALLVFPNAPPIALLGAGGLLASLGFSGIRALIAAWKGKK